MNCGYGEKRKNGGLLLEGKPCVLQSALEIIFLALHSYLPDVTEIYRPWRDKRPDDLFRLAAGRYLVVERIRVALSPLKFIALPK